MIVEDINRNKPIKSDFDLIIEYLENKINKCNEYSKYIDKKTKELHGRMGGKTYIASEIMKNEASKKTYQEILGKIKELLH